MSDARRDLPEKSAYLVVLAAGPTIWIAHFLVTYTTVAVACGPRGPEGDPMATAQLLVLGFTLAALAGIAVVAWSGWRRHTHGSESLPHDMDSPGDRHRFLGFATSLLAGLSALATVFVAVSVTFFVDCR